MATSFASNVSAGLVEVTHDLGLAPDGQVLAGELDEVDVAVLAVKRDFDAAMQQLLLLHAVCDLRLVEQLYGAALKHAGANAGFAIFAGLVLQYDGLDTVQVQELRQQQPRRTRPDNTDLRAHGASIGEPCYIILRPQGKVQWL